MQNAISICGNWKLNYYYFWLDRKSKWKTTQKNKLREKLSGQKFAQFHREIYRISNFSTWKKLRIAFFNHRSIPGIKSVIPQDNLHLPQNGEKQRKTLFPISP